MRRLSVFLFALILSACTTPQTATPPSSPPHGTASTATLSSPDLSCKVDADCAVKDVGNCCGYYPACVNKDAVVDPAAVQAQCRASGRMSVCGFREIASCACVQGKCAAAGGGVKSLLPAEE